MTDTNTQTYQEMMYCYENLLDLEPYIIYMENNGYNLEKERERERKKKREEKKTKGNVGKRKRKAEQSKMNPSRRKEVHENKTKNRPIIPKHQPNFDSNYFLDIPISDEVFYQIEDFLRKENVY